MCLVYSAVNLPLPHHTYTFKVLYVFVCWTVIVGEQQTERVSERARWWTIECSKKQAKQWADEWEWQIVAAPHGMKFYQRMREYCEFDKEMCFAASCCFFCADNSIDRFGFRIYLNIWDHWNIWVFRFFLCTIYSRMRNSTKKKPENANITLIFPN